MRSGSTDLHSLYSPRLQNFDELITSAHNFPGSSHPFAFDPIMEQIEITLGYGPQVHIDRTSFKRKNASNKRPPDQLPNRSPLNPSSSRENGGIYFPPAAFPLPLLPLPLPLGRPEAFFSFGSTVGAGSSSSPNWASSGVRTYGTRAETSFSSFLAVEAVAQR